MTGGHFLRNDKSYKVCYNVNAFEKVANGKVKAFLKYVKTQSATDSFTQRLENIVALTKESKVFRRYYMMRNIFIDDWMDRGRLVGLQQGIAQATALPLAEVQKIAAEMSQSASA